VTTAAKMMAMPCREPGLASEALTMVMLFCTLLERATLAEMQPWAKCMVKTSVAF